MLDSVSVSVSVAVSPSVKDGVSLTCEDVRARGRDFKSDSG